MNLLFDGLSALGSGFELTLLRITLVLGLAWMGHFVVRRGNPRWRILLWRLAAVGIVLVGLISLVPLRLTLPLLDSTADVPELAINEPIATASSVEPKNADKHSQLQSLVATRVSQEIPSQPSTVVEQSISPAVPRQTALEDPVDSLSAAITVNQAMSIYDSLLGSLLIVWGIGVAYVLMRWLLGLGRLLSIYRQASPISAEIATELSNTKAELGYLPKVDIRQTNLLESPCVVGFLRPLILIPRSQISHDSIHELRASMAHELAHCQGHDLGWSHLLTLLQALLWFHPLSWRVSSAHATACDERCDAVAAGYLGDKKLYGRLLAVIALRVCRFPAMSGLSMARPSRIRRRIELLLGERSTARLPKALTSGVAVVFLAVFFCIGSVIISRSEAEEQDASLPIQVTSLVGGKPLEGVSLKFNGRINGQPVNLVLTTDAEGVTKLQLPANRQVQRLWVTAQKPGYVPVHYMWRDEVKEVELPKSLMLQLADGLPISGRVEDEAGQPIAGAQVRLTMPITSPKRDSWVFTAAELTTDQEGRWKWDGAPKKAGSISVRVDHPDFMKGNLSASQGAGNVAILKRGLQVQGRVVDSKGTPVSGAKVQLGFDHFGTGQPSAQTDDEGNYVLKKCKPGQSAVTVQAAGLSPKFQKIKVTESTQPVNFELKPGQLLRGKVVDMNGQPLAGVIVASDTWQGLRTLDNRMTTDEKGQFTWDGAPADGVQYDILKDGYMARRNFVLKAEAKEHVITLQPELQITGKVTDAATGQPIPDFVIRHGYRFANSQQTHWSGDAGVPFKNGEYSYKFNEPMESRVLQAVAKGYQPQTSRHFKTDEIDAEFNFELQPGTGPSGIVMTPAGKLAEGAEVGLATRERKASFDMGHFSRQNQAEVVTTKKNGHFAFLPRDDEPYLLVALHETGYAEVMGDELGEFGRIVLQPWGQIRGRALSGDQPDVGRQVHFSPKRRDGKNYHNYLWDFGYKIKTDEQGRFNFERVMPGPGILSRVVITEFLSSQQHTIGWQTPVEVRPHETAEAVIGGTGRPIVGKVVLDRKPEVDIDWTTNEPASITRWNTKQNRRTQPYARYLGPIDKDGVFRIPDVPAGNYQLTVPVNNPPTPNACGAGTAIGKAVFEFTIPEIPEGRSDEPLQLGTVTATLFDTLDPGELAPDFVAEDLAGGTLKLSDYHGKLVLLDFWATSCKPCLVAMPAFKQLHAKFGENPKFAMVSLSCDSGIEVARNYVTKNSLDWKHAHVLGTSASAPRDYTVRSLPATFLIAPDGTVLAKNLQEDDLASAISAALENEKLFNMKKARPARYPVVQFKTNPSPSSLKRPAVVVLDNTDPTFDKDKPHHDSLRALDEKGQVLWSHSDFNSAGTVGGVHGVVIDARRGRIYVRESVSNRITAFDLAGQKLWRIDSMEADTLLVDERTGNLWCSGGPRLNSGETVVFNATGEEVAAFPYRAIDMAYDPHSDTFWLVGYEILRLSREGKVLLKKPVEGWCCASVSVNPKNGNVWIAERDHPDVARSKNRLWLFDAKGAVLRKIDLENHIFIVACDPRTGDAFFSGYQAGFKRVSADGQPQDISDVQVTNISPSPTQDTVWVTTKQEIKKLDHAGKTILTIPFSEKSSQAWLAAF